MDRVLSCLYVAGGGSREKLEEVRLGLLVYIFRDKINCNCLSSSYSSLVLTLFLLPLPLPVRYLMPSRCGSSLSFLDILSLIL